MPSLALTRNAVVLALLVLSVAVGCGPAHGDAGTDGVQDLSTSEVEPSGSDPGAETIASVDAVEFHEAVAEAVAETAVDATAESAPDAPADVSPDVQVDVVPDVPSDVAPDLPGDVAPDASGDAGPDVPPDPGVFVPVEQGSALADVPVTDPAAAVTVTVGDQLEVIVPSGAVASPAQIIVTGGLANPELSAVWSPVAAYDVTLLVDGVPVQPAAPITLRYKVFPEHLRADLPLADQIIMATFDASLGYWSEIPFEIEQVDGLTWIRVTTAHLSGFLQSILGPDYTVMTSPGWRFYYNSNVAAAGFGAYDIFGVVAAYRTLLMGAFGSIKAWLGVDGSTLPATISVYVLPDANGGAYYNPYTGNVVLNSYVSNDDEARYEAVHELVHLVQNGIHNMFKMDERRWYIEAEADYLAEQFLKTGRLATLLDETYFTLPLNLVNEKHEYATGWFIDWILVRGGSASVRALHDAVFASNTDLGADAFLAAVSNAAKKYQLCDLTDCDKPATAMLVLATWLVFRQESPLAGKSFASDWANAHATLSLTEESTPVGGGAMPYQVSMIAVTAQWYPDLALLPRPAYLTWSSFEPGCRYFVWVGGDGWQQGVAKENHPEGPGTATMKLSDGQLIEIMASGDCSGSLTAISQIRCLMNLDVYGMQCSPCVDLKGVHTVQNVCLDQTHASQHCYACQGDGSAGCVDVGAGDITCPWGLTCAAGSCG